MKKRITLFTLMCILCFTLIGAAPVFAEATPRAYCPVNTPVNLLPIISEGAGGANVRLNISTNLGQTAAETGLPDNTNVNVYSPTGHWSQTWYFTNEGRSDGYYMLRNYYVTGQALNISFYSSSYLNCDVVRWNNNIYDSAVGSSGWATFGFQSQHYQQYWLAATSGSSGANVKWNSNVAPPAGYMFAWGVA